METETSTSKQGEEESGLKPEEDTRQEECVNVQRLNRILGDADKPKLLQGDVDETDGFTGAEMLEEDEEKPEFIARNFSGSGDAVSTENN